MKSRIYLLLPYLNCLESFSIEEIYFKGLFEGGEKVINNLEKEDENDVYHLERILGSFRVGSNQGLQGFIYSIQEVSTQRDYEELKKRVEIAMNLIRYKLFDKDERGYITFPQTTLFVFELTEKEWHERARKLRSSEKEFIWYKGLRNFLDEVSIHWPAEQIYPPAQRMSMGYLNFSSDYFLISGLKSENWKMRKLKEEERLRIIRALEHYNKSFSEGSGIDDRDRILSLSAGFEALLNLSDERIQQSFKSVIITLLGDVSNLGDWALEFYNLRSKIIHGSEIATNPGTKRSNSERKKTPSLYFKHAEGEREYINHLKIGQSVFRKCLECIINQRNGTYTKDITSMLIPNEVHIKHIESGIKGLKNRNSLEDWYNANILEAYDELRAKDNTAQSEKIVEIGKELLIVLKEYLHSKKKPLDEQIDYILTFKGLYVDLAIAYSLLLDEYQKIYFGNETQRQLIYEYAFENAVYNFLSFASQLLFVFDGNVI